MRFSLIFLFVSIIASEKHDDETEEDSEESVEKPITNEETALNFKGNIRKLFVLEAGLHADGKNVICSPLSALMPLAKLSIGAKKKSPTESELLRAIGIKKPNQLNREFKQIIKDLEFLEGVEISLASRIYLSKTKKIRPRFLSRAQSIFGSGVELVDMDRPKEVAYSVNEWVYEHTKKKINQVITERDIVSGTSLILVNAIYFKGNWKDPFKGVHLQKFYTPSGTINVPMMSRVGLYNYFHCEDLNAQVLEIPYMGEQASLIIVLPFSNSALPILLHTLKLTPELLTKALSKMTMVSVDVTIPKFKIETSLDLKQYYQQMGVKNSLSPDHSELTRVIKDENVHISKAIHKAVIEVNEKGTEAAAVSVFITTLSMPMDFDANHPFLFYVQANNEQLFAGVVCDPNQENYETDINI